METKRLTIYGFLMLKKILFFLSSRKRTYIQFTAFLLIEAFENYMDNVEVETKAIQLSKKYNITNVLSISEFDVVRSARLRDTTLSRSVIDEWNHIEIKY